MGSNSVIMVDPAEEVEMIKRQVGEWTMECEWKKVVELYNSKAEAHSVRISGYKSGTALHVALERNEDQVAQLLLKAMLSVSSSLEMEDESGDTALHVAASKGFVGVCRLIIGGKEERKSLVKKRNKKGETPLFLAALRWNRNKKGDSNKSTVAYLIHLLHGQAPHIPIMDDVVRHDQDTLLHLAIRNQYFDLAIIILHYYEFLGEHTNKEGKFPLQALADVPSAFRSGTKIFGWSLILYHWIIIPRLDPESALRRYMRSEENIRYLPENYYNFLYHVLKKLFHIIQYGKSRLQSLFFGYDIKISNDKEEITYDYSRGWLPPNYSTLREFINALVAGFVGLSGLGRFGYDSVKMKKATNKWSRQLLRELLEKPYAEQTVYGRRTDVPNEYDSDIFNAYYQGESRGSKASLPQGDAGGSKGRSGEGDETGGSKVKEKEENDKSAFVIAVKNGIVEMVKDILGVMPNAINDKSKNGENVFVMALNERQPFVFLELKKHLRDREDSLEDFLCGPVDDKGNTILHLAAKVVPGNRPGQVVGDALQMMWDAKWFEYIKEQVPQHYQLLANEEKKTPIEIFKEQHKELIKNGSGWLKETSDSCSVVAALIAGVSFATACTVPGGNNNGGESPFEDSPAFQAFAISSLIGLCLSVTALTMFLSILTSRKSARDFLGSLPRKLLFGLSSLFISIMAMFVSFCSGHYFLVEKSYKPGSLFLLYGATAFPVIFFAMAQFPLYYDLFVTFLSKAPHKAKGIGTTL